MQYKDSEKHYGPVARLLAVVAGGALQAFCWPRVGWWPLSFFVLVPLILAVAGQKPKRAFFLGWLYGLSLTAFSIPWIIEVLVGYGGMGVFLGWLVFILMSALILAMYHGFFAWLICRPWRRRVLWMLAGALFMCGLDWLKNWVFTGFNWTPLAGPLVLSPHFSQFGDLFGFYGLGFFVALVNFLLADLILVRPKLSRMLLRVLWALVLVGAIWLYGYFSLERWQKIEGSDIFEMKKISVIQPSVPQDKKWSVDYRDELLKRYATLLEEAGKENPWLIVWPETALPFIYEYHQYETEWLDELSAASPAMLVGVSATGERDGRKELYNRAWLFQAGKPGPFYDKRHRVPFGEYVPLDWLPFLKWEIFNGLLGEAGAYDAGREYPPISLDGHTLGALICFESIFPYLARERVQDGAAFLVVTTNDAWFGHSAAPGQHLVQAAMRAIETRRSLVRAANNGLSALIYPDGRIVEQSRLDEIRVLNFNVPVMKEGHLFKTFFVHYGFYFGPFCGLLTALGILGTFIFRRKA